MQHVFTHKESRYHGELYRIVFECVYVKIAIALLFFAFMLQPIPPLYANEVVDNIVEDEVAEVVPPDDEEESEPEMVSEVEEESSEETSEGAEEEALVGVSDSETGNTESFETEVQSETEESGEVADVDLEEERDVQSEEIVVDARASTSVESSEETSASTTPSDDTDIDADTSGSSSGDDSSSGSENDSSVDDVDESVSSTTETATNETEATTEGTTDNSDVSPNEEENVEGDNNEEDNEVIKIEDFDAESEDLATTSPAVEATTASSSGLKVEAKQQQASNTPPVITLSTVTNAANKHQFSVDDCTSVGDGAFYCTKASKAPNLLEDGVFAVPDADGDMEILVRVAGKEEFITQNEVDDGAPHYDSTSDRIVWHTLKNDRYQIMSYEYNTGDTTAITNKSYNNMEPVAYGRVTLWQAWIGNNWEIMMHDGASTTQLTHNDTHDVAPSMRGGYILWQTQFADGWKVAMYDLETQKIRYVGEGSGMQTENPRLVLVYDSLSENGDIETVGYDLESGELVPLARIPTKLPEEIPDPDQTGETRALIQNKSHNKETEIVDVLSPTSSSSPNHASGTAAVDSHTLDLASSTPTTSVSATSTEEISTVVVPSLREQAEETIDALILEKKNTASTTHIADIVIPPLATSSDAMVR